MSFERQSLCYHLQLPSFQIHWTVLRHFKNSIMLRNSFFNVANAISLSCSGEDNNRSNSNEVSFVAHSIKCISVYSLLNSIFSHMKLTVDEQHRPGSPPNSSAGLKHGLGSGGRFLSVPGKHSFGKDLQLEGRKNCMLRSFG